MCLVFKNFYISKKPIEVYVLRRVMSDGRILSLFHSKEWNLKSVEVDEVSIGRVERWMLSREESEKIPARYFQSPRRNGIERAMVIQKGMFHSFKYKKDAEALMGHLYYTKDPIKVYKAIIPQGTLYAFGYNTRVSIDYFPKVGYASKVLQLIEEVN